MKRKVSVIIPTYKRSDFLLRAIDSVKKQTYKNIEIIVVDDNDSLSEFRKINEEKLFKYKDDKNFIYIKHDKNKNGAAARNTGISVASGEYITFLDDDDYYLPDRIKELVGLLEKNKDYDCAYTSVAMLNNHNIVDVITANKTGNFKLELLKQYSFFCTGSNLFFRRKAIDKVGKFDEKFIRHQDIEYMIRFFDIGNVISLNKILVVKCLDDNSNFPDFNKFLSIKKLFFEKFEYCINQMLEEKKDIYFCNYYELLWVALNDDNNNYKNIVFELKKYGKIRLRDKLRILYRRKLKKIFIIRKINNLLKKLSFIKKKVIINKLCDSKTKSQISFYECYDLG